jgi:exonuclease III
MKFLYWNINNQPSPFEDQLKSLINDKIIDVLILSENKLISDDKLINDIGFVPVELKLNNSKSRWVQVFYRKNDDYEITHFNEHTEVDEDDLTNAETDEIKQVNRVQVFKISGKVIDTFFACIHFPSKLYHDDITHLQIVPNYKEKIHSLTLNSKRLFIVGDFNMNPFDYGMVEPQGFFAHNNRELITSDTKTKFGRSNTMYYNPSWTLLGDFVNKSEYKANNRSGGSFYYKEKKSRCLYWHLIDQIIMRHSLIDEFVSEELEIIEDETLKNELIKDKVKGINKVDHFPLKFSFNFKNKDNE